MLDRILLSRFRNHRDTAVEGTAQFNLLVGENGAGKTNVLEAISLLAPGRGLRRAALADMPGQAFDGGFAVSAALAVPGGEPVRLGTGVLPERPSRRLVQINGAEAPAVRLAEWFSIGWLTPAMDRLFMDSAGGRRRFLDRLVLAVRPDHAAQASRLENAVRERNRLLSDVRPPDPHWLDAIELQIAESGAAVAGARADLILRLDAALAALPDSPFARPSLAYRPGGPVQADALAVALHDGRPRDRAAQRTLTGPHRDELDVTMAGKNQPAAECSTGEQKAMLIAITLAHSQLLEGGGEDRPRLLLLDEVAAHLDPVRREALFDRLRAGSAQIWLTGTETTPFEAILSEASVWEVSSGSVRRL
ncbi:DNA replication/repair protein RecF [Novosphingobium album (ex Hu et al. 2023)]|uniref:DNA replication and repair protein RecF n=1 Tax=Novosphingobium album (ex Hu et al. 2023) TaxID=2930093 RepID=A0ABT0AZD1_9SPHN|nr:DNA replication/repair protein RecF [Novosphingobium album (ex Hu et al. 2023)]MCJ2178152.1 DNA replication/repair protein RecF [Novosphingobium album (ex Hu et al. 2023)]